MGQALSTIPDNDYGYKLGTSMAAPHVAGAAALSLSMNTEASYEEVKQGILDTVTPLEAWDDLVISGGRLNAGALVSTLVTTGELTVSLEPGEAVDAGAQWRVVGEDPWRDSGESVTLETGEYEVEFAELEHWEAPTSLAVEIGKDEPVEETAEYQRAQGGLQITIKPESAVDDEAQWSVDGGDTWRDSGDTVTLDTGEYTVEFRELDHWVAPSSVAVEIIKDTVTEETAEYQRAQGMLEVSLEPEDAREAGAQWRVVGEDPWRESGERVTLDTGEYEVEFTELDHWAAPSPVSVDVIKETTTWKAATYARATGELTVTLEPGEARADGARWSVDGGGIWRESGDTVELETGTYDVSCAVIDYWLALDPLSVEVEADALTTRSVEYVRGEGVLEVFLDPADAVADGAQWSVDYGETLHDSGDEVEVEAGEHHVLFTPLRGWVRPEARLVEVPKDGAATAQGTYQAREFQGAPLSRPGGLAALAAMLLAVGWAYVARMRALSQSPDKAERQVFTSPGPSGHPLQRGN